jgi:hypothetical protein
MIDLALFDEKETCMNIMPHYWMVYPRQALLFARLIADMLRLFPIILLSTNVFSIQCCISNLNNVPNLGAKSCSDFRSAGDLCVGTLCWPGDPGIVPGGRANTGRVGDLFSRSPICAPSLSDSHVNGRQHQKYVSLFDCFVFEPIIRYQMSLDSRTVFQMAMQQGGNNLFTPPRVGTQSRSTFLHNIWSAPRKKFYRTHDMATLSHCTPIRKSQPTGINCENDGNKHWELMLTFEYSMSDDLMIEQLLSDLGVSWDASVSKVRSLPELAALESLLFPRGLARGQVQRSGTKQEKLAVNNAR